MFKPMVGAQRWIAAGLFDPAIREKAGMRWTPSDEVVLRLFGKLVELAFVAVPDEIRLHPRALAAYKRADGRVPEDAPLVEAPAFMSRRGTGATCRCTTSRRARRCSIAPARWCTPPSPWPACGRHAVGKPERQPEHMLEWSEVDLAVRDAVREFVDKEIRPHLDELESGEMAPYPIIRKLFATFGIDAMAKDSLKKRLARCARRRVVASPHPVGCSAAAATRAAWASSWSVSCAGCRWASSPEWASASV